MHPLRILFACLTLVLLPSQAWAAFSYEPFPRLPAVAVEEHKFVEGLRDACAALSKTADTSPALTAPNVCPAAPSVPGPAALAEHAAEARKLKKGLAAAECGVAQLAAEKVAGYAEALKNTCRKLRRPGSALDSSDLEVLTKARDASDVLALIVNWSDGGFDAAKTAPNQYAGGALSGVPSLGALSDQLVRGMAEFLSKRAQEEALRYLRKKLKAELCDADELRKQAFSNVCSAIANLADGTSLEAIGGYLRSAAEKDLHKLPDLLLQYLEEKEPSKADFTFAARVGLAYYGAVRNGRDPFEVLYSFGELAPQSCEASRCASVSKSLRFASAVAYSLRQGGEDWVEAFPDDVEAGDARVMGVALVLLVEKRLATLEARGKGALGIGVDAAFVNRVLLAPADLVSSSIALVRGWQALAARLKSDLSEDERRQALATAMEESVQSATRILEALERVRTGTSSPSVTDGARAARSFAGIAADLVRREYGAAVTSALAELTEIGSGRGAPGPVLKHLPLIVEVAAAKSSSEVAATFDAYAAPIGSAELKYKQPVLSINGYLGGLGGFEHMSSDGLSGVAPITAVYAPVGVHLSTPLGGEKFHIGIMLSLLDLGALTTFRYGAGPEGELDEADPMDTSEPEAATAPQIGLEQVLSPGVNVMLGLGGIPLVFGAGLSLSPELREVSQDTATTDVSVLRVGAFLAVDMPILILN